MKSNAHCRVWPLYSRLSLLHEHLKPYACKWLTFRERSFHIPKLPSRWTEWLFCISNSAPQSLGNCEISKAVVTVWSPSLAAKEPFIWEAQVVQILWTKASHCSKVYFEGRWTGSRLLLRLTLFGIASRGPQLFWGIAPKVHELISKKPKLKKEGRLENDVWKVLLCSLELILKYRWCIMCWKNV